jgi:hypothetical protein
MLVEGRRIGAGAMRPGWYLRQAGRLAAWCVLILTVSLIWLVPFFRYIGIKVTSETFFQIRGAWKLVSLLAKPGNIPALVLVALSIAGAVGLIRSGRAAEAAAPLAASSFLLVISAYGVHLPPFDQMEPGRFLVPALIFPRRSGPRGAAGMGGAYHAEDQAFKGDQGRCNISIVNLLAGFRDDRVAIVLPSHPQHHLSA